MTRAVNAAGIAILKQWEQGPGGGPALVPYTCPAGKLTIGYGHVIAPAERDFLQKITPERADAVLQQDAAWAACCVERAVAVPIGDNQFSALVCFAFNVGGKAFIDSTLLRVLNAGSHDDVPAQLRRWDHAGGKVLAGLDRRREAEVALWLTPDKES